MHLAAQLVVAIFLGLLTYIPRKVERPWWSPRARAWKTGDMILFRTTDPLFRLSTVITQAEFSHIGVVVAPPDSEYPMIIESLAKGHHASADLWTGRVKDGPQLQPLVDLQALLLCFPRVGCASRGRSILLRPCLSSFPPEWAWR